MARVYQLKQKSTGLFYIGILWKSVGKMKDYGHVPSYHPVSLYYDIESINFMTQQALNKGHGAILDDLELLTFEEQTPIPIKTSIKYESIKKRHEARMIMTKLKNEI